MTFYKAMLATAAMATVIGTGMVMMSKGNPWLLIASMVATIIAFARYGCLSH